MFFRTESAYHLCDLTSGIASRFQRTHLLLVRPFMKLVLTFFKRQTKARLDAPILTSVYGEDAKERMNLFARGAYVQKILTAGRKPNDFVQDH